jgi:dTDP-glucose 4,6-dehydratase
MAVVNFAAETHVDRSILFPSDFLQSNVMGVFNLIEEVREYWKDLPDLDKDRFRFLQVSTDEVYGSLAPEAPPCDESAPFAPNSPYAATKAAADHLARVYFVTYGFPTTIARCCNNYGAFQYPEKLIPLMIMRAVAGDTLPVYGDGNQIRDWLYVEDHCKALNRILELGRAGEVYNISGQAEMTNLEVVRKLCALLDEIHPRKSGTYMELIRHVADRAGHDRRYALSSAKIRRDLGWQPAETLASGLEKTVRWYLDNIAWLQKVTGHEMFADWIALNYQQRRVI